jgi:hypothetical protein
MTKTHQSVLIEYKTKIESFPCESQIMMMISINLKFVEEWGLYLTSFTYFIIIIKRFFTLALAKIEAKLTNEQIEYLHQRKSICFGFIILKIHLSLGYAISHYADKTELKEVAKQWNKNGSKFLLDLRVRIVFIFWHYSYIFSICSNGFFVVEWLI